jgi:hypothetical protein
MCIQHALELRAVQFYTICATTKIGGEAYTVLPLLCFPLFCYMFNLPYRQIAFFFELKGFAPPACLFRNRWQRVQFTARLFRPTRWL